MTAAPSPWAVGDLPAEAPLAMPVQDLAAPPRPSLRPKAEPAMLARRIVILGGAGAIGLVASCGVALPLAINGFDLVDQVVVLLSLALFAWLSVGFLTSLAGLALLWRGTVTAPIGRRPGRTTAVLVPAYNEEVAPLVARLARIAGSLDRLGVADRFDLFVLSDSDAAAEPRERGAVHQLRRRIACPLYYRRRPRNEARKPGNIAEWVGRFGAAYDGMIVLDADSLMTGAAMVHLVLALEEDATLGLVQTNVQLTGARTLFARWQQFSAACYGPLAGAGLAWWSGDAATFWGHNAILRTRAFAESCGLPRLDGPEPFGGHVQSHDMVEAALLRRRGWACRLLPLADGSYEESPPTLADHSVRDRRWAQGNLQHLRLLDMGGLHWLSRLQLLMGASAYLTAPMWLLLLALGLFQSLRLGTPMADLGAPPWLLVVTGLLLFGPKLMAVAWAARSPKLVARLGGWRAIARSVAVEVPLSIVIAPVIMGSQCLAIAEIMSGRPSGWRPQRRHSDGIALSEALDAYRWHMLLGLVFWAVSWSELGGAAWGLPVAVGLLGAPFIAVATSRADLGARAATLGIFPADPAEQLDTAPAPVRPGPWVAGTMEAA